MAHFTDPTQSISLTTKVASDFLRSTFALGGEL